MNKPLIAPIYRIVRLLFVVLVAATPTISLADAPSESGSDWIQLFNGKDLEKWTPKIRGHKLGENYADTFRVRDGKLVVTYEDYTASDMVNMDGKSEKGFDRFGHLFYNGTFSHYLLQVEYRFVGEQIENGAAWAWRNNGLMLHGQDPKLMAIDQKFPVSIEVQLLGGDGQKPRTNLNLCTPGTNVVLDGKLFKPHCTSSRSKTYPGDRWVTAEVEVRGNQIVRHKLDGEIVLQYTNPQLDPGDPEAQALIVNGDLMIDRGTISLQSESHPTEFRKIQLRVLDKNSPIR